MRYIIYTSGGSIRATRLIGGWEAGRQLSATAAASLCAFLISLRAKLPVNVEMYKF